MGKNFKKNFPKKTTDMKKTWNGGKGSVSKPGQNKNKGNRYFSKSLENVKSPGQNTPKTPNSFNKMQTPNFGSNKKSPFQTPKSNNKNLNGKGKTNQKFQTPPSSQKKAEIKKKEEESENSESFDQDDDSDYDEEELKKMVQSKLFKLKGGEQDSDDDDDDLELNEDDFDDLEDSEDDEDDDDEAEDGSPKKAAIKMISDDKIAGKKRKLEEEDDDDSAEIDSDDEDQLKAMLEESSDEEDAPPAKKSKAEVKLDVSKSKSLNQSDSASKAKSPSSGRSANNKKETPSSKPQEKKIPVETKKTPPKSQTPSAKQQKKESNKKPAETSEKSSDKWEPCKDQIQLPSGKSASLKLADKEKLFKLIKDRMSVEKKRTIFIRPVPRNCKPSMLKELAKEMIDCRIPYQGKKSRGFALLEFKTPQIAEKYRKMLNGKNFCGKTLVALLNDGERSRTIVPESVQFNELYVSGLPKETTRADLKYIFPENCGVDMPVFKDNNSKGFALIKFSLPETALNYFETRHLTTIRNREISVNFCIRNKKNAKNSPVKQTGKNKPDKTSSSTKQPAIKLDAIAPKKPTVMIEEVDDDDDDSESETEEALAKVKSEKQDNVSKAGDIVAALRAIQAECDDDESEDEEDDDDDDESEDDDDESDDEEDEDDASDDDEDMKSPPAKRKPT